MRIQSASLKVFCHPEELGQWLDRLSTTAELGWIAFHLGHGQGVQGTGSLAPHLGPNCRRVFFFPLNKSPRSGLTLTEVKSRPWGWIDVNPGTVLEKSGTTILSLTLIDAEEGYSEDGAKLCKHVRELKKSLHNTITFGVYGRLIEGSGGSVYKNIGYTDKAAELHRTGTLLMQDGVNNVAFDPLGIRRQSEGKVG